MGKSNTFWIGKATYGGKKMRNPVEEAYTSQSASLELSAFVDAAYAMKPLDPPLVWDFKDTGLKPDLGMRRLYKEIGAKGKDYEFRTFVIGTRCIVVKIPNYREGESK